VKDSEEVVCLRPSRLSWEVLVMTLFTFQPERATGGSNMEISSSAFKDGGKIPIPYVMPGAGGKNISVPLSWKNTPSGTKSFALSMVDPHPVAQNWVHWLVINIPATATSLEEGASRKKMPQGSMELKNSFGDIGYGGPQPPKGTGDHPYVFTLYALNVERLDLGTNTLLSSFNRALEGKIVGSATITGKYGR
jgi:Raf kinase inhibitor-like YbhB/YbcL family protein